jgi:hypothetical protein
MRFGGFVHDGVEPIDLAAETLAELRRRAADTLLVSVCTGGMILGASGVLDGKPATTKREVVPPETPPIDILRREHPRIDVREASLVDAGTVVTGEGDRAHPGIPARVGRQPRAVPAAAGSLMDYAFLVETHPSERLKTHPNLARDRTFREHVVHQCFREDEWFTGMFESTSARRRLPRRERAWGSSGATPRTPRGGWLACRRRTARGGRRRSRFSLPGPGSQPSTERP